MSRARSVSGTSSTSGSDSNSTSPMPPSDARDDVNSSDDTDDDEIQEIDLSKIKPPSTPASGSSSTSARRNTRSSIFGHIQPPEPEFNELAPINRAPSGVPIILRRQENGQVIAQQWYMSTESSRVLYENIERQKGAERQLQADELRAQKKAEAIKAAAERAALKLIRDKQWRDAKIKASEWLQKFLILLGLLVVLYFVVDAMLPGTLQKQQAVVMQHLKQVVAYVNAAVSSGRARAGLGK